MEESLALGFLMNGRGPTFHEVDEAVAVVDALEKALRGWRSTRSAWRGIVVRRNSKPDRARRSQVAVESLRSELKSGRAEGLILQHPGDGSKAPVAKVSLMFADGGTQRFRLDAVATRSPHNLDDAAAADDAQFVRGVIEGVLPYVSIVSGHAELIAGGNTSAALPRLVEYSRMARVRGRSDSLFGYQWLQLLTPAVQQRLRDAGRELGDMPALQTRWIPSPDGAVLEAIVCSNPYVPDYDAMRRFRSYVLPVLAAVGPAEEGSIAAVRGGPRPPSLLPEDWPSGD